VGIFRLILALCVVVAHASPLPGLPTLDAGLAVKTFFMISGFYMALILAEKYPATPAGRSLFYTNRFLRIYPLYLITLIGALLFYAAASVKLGHPADRLQLWSAAWGRGERGSLFLVGLSQVTVFGLDLTPLFSFSPSAGFHLLASSLPADATHAWRLNFLPHCWSIGAELLFYALSPFLMRLRPAAQVLFCAVGLAGAVGVQSVDHPLANSAAYHVGLLQLPYFLLGIVAYTVLGKVPVFRPSWGVAAVPVIVGVILTFSGWPALGKLGGYVYLFTAWLLIPMLFNLSKKSSWDRWLGEFSYPVYLLHVPAKWVLLAARGVQTKDAVEVPGWALILATLAGAAVLVVLIDRPLERYRRNRFERGMGTTIDASAAKS